MKNATLTLVLTCACMAIKCYAVVISADAATRRKIDATASLKLVKGTFMTFVINGGTCPDNVSINVKSVTYGFGFVSFTKVNNCTYTFTVNDTATRDLPFLFYGDAENWRTDDIKLELVLSVGASQVYNWTKRIPGANTCSATVNNLTTGNIALGSSPASISLPISISGSASSKSLVISGVDIQSDGKLNLGGSSSGVKVYPASNYISGSTWNAGSSSGSLPLTVDVSAGKVGTWTSSLFATLTCS